MSTLTQRNWFVYTADDATEYSVLIQSFVGLHADFGFQVFDAAVPIFPDGMRMRGVYMAHPTDGRVRFMPVGTRTADPYANESYTTNIKDEGDATGATWSATGVRGERKRKKRDIHPA